jgi:hypothetical protein
MAGHKVRSVVGQQRAKREVMYKNDEKIFLSKRSLA